MTPKRLELFILGLKHRNPYDDRFWRNLIEQSVGDTEAAINEWTVEQLRGSGDLYFEEPPECICGKRDLVHVYILKNEQNANRIILGSCCVRRWQIAVPGWRGKRNYLQMALLMVRNDQQRQFVKDLLGRSVKYPRGLIVTQKQKAWLESITGHPWTGRLWKR